MVIDCLDAESAEITVDQFGKLWVNIDGKCVVRIGHVKMITMDDPVRGFDVVYQGESDEGEKGVDISAPPSHTPLME